jgi:hypothetical protein
MQQNQSTRSHPFLRPFPELVLGMAILLLPLVCLADVVTLNDGRRFEGQTLSEKNDFIVFDTLISGIRAKVSFKRSDVKSVEKSALPDGFFNDSENEPRAAGTQASAKEPTLYLEVPINGRFKEQVFARVVRSSLVYSKARSIKHVVFTVDSTGGALDEAGMVARAMRDFNDVLTYHAIIRNCTGEAVIVPFMCDTMHVLPGATVTGLVQKLEGLPFKYAKQDEAVVRLQIADDLVEAARKRGRKGDIIRAMVDPADPLAAWLDSNGKVVMDHTPPKDLPSERLIFAHQAESVLTLTYEQICKLGVPTIEGGPAALGDLLGLPNWKEESAYGRDAANRAIAMERQKASNAQSKAAAAQAKYEDDVSRNIRMRDITQRAIESNLKQASTWNPTTASYKTLSQYITWGWDPNTQWDTHIWTPDSQARWRSRSEACAYFLNRAADGIKTMMKLDAEAVKLGLSPTFKEGDLQFMLDDVNVKREMLRRGQFRVGE